MRLVLKNRGIRLWSIRNRIFTALYVEENVSSMTGEVPYTWRENVVTAIS